MIVGLVGEAVVIAEDIRPLIPRLCLSPDNNIAGGSFFYLTIQKDGAERSLRDL